MNPNFDTQYELCMLFFNELAALLNDSYTVVGSCNQDRSAYLVPKGSENDISYHGKPAFSFRISDHWNWKSNLKKNKNERYIQCFTRDLPRSKPRNGEGKSSNPIWANSVCYFDDDNEYHVLYGEKFDRKTKKWTWVEGNARDLVENGWLQQFCCVDI